MKQTGLMLVFWCVSSLSMAQVQRTVSPKRSDSAGITRGIDNTSAKADRRKMMNELQLSKEQRSKMKEIRQAAQAKEDAVANDDKLTAEQKESRMRELKQERMQGMQSVLNDEQKTKMRSMRMEKRKQQGADKNN